MTTVTGEVCDQEKASEVEPCAHDTTINGFSVIQNVSSQTFDSITSHDNSSEVSDSDDRVTAVDRLYQYHSALKYRMTVYLRIFSVSILGFDIVNLSKLNIKVLKSGLILSALVFIFVQSRRSKDTIGYKLQRFFPRHSLITDFWTGDLHFLQEELYNSDLSIVLYYAPWDRECQELRSKLVKVASLHHEQIYFAAINCWQPGSSCRITYKFQRFPVLVLHIRIPSSRDTHTVPYNGPLTTQHINRFIRKAYSPLIHVANHAELVALQLESLAVVVGYHLFGDRTPGYLTFYYSSLASLQWPSLYGVSWAVVTNEELAHSLHLSKEANINLVLWNNTMVLPLTSTKSVTSINQALHNNLVQSILWLDISGRKSLTLNNIYNEGPFLLLFSPDNPYQHSNDPFTVVRSISLEYFNCHSCPRIKWMSDHLTAKNRYHLREADKLCRKHKNSNLHQKEHIAVNTEKPNCKESISSHLNLKNDKGSFFLNSWSSASSFMLEASLMQRKQCSNAEKGCIGRCHGNDCSSDCHANKGVNQTTVKHKQYNKYYHELYPSGIVDDRVAALSLWRTEMECQLLILGSLYAPHTLLKEHSHRLAVSDAACTRNRTLNFIALDSLLHHEFASRLGIDLAKASPSNTGVVIVDPSNEEFYIMKESFSRNAVVNFVNNFTANSLNRSLPSSTLVEPETDRSSDKIQILELNSETYMDVTHQRGQAFVVVHYTHFCGGCSAIWSTVLQCASFIASQQPPLGVVLARINVATNALQWHLHFTHVPTIIFFPKYKKSDSRVFEPTEPITVTSLMAFILSGLGAKQRLQIALNACSSEECLLKVASRRLLALKSLEASMRKVSARRRRCLKYMKDIDVSSGKLSDLTLYKILASVFHSLGRNIGSMQSRIKHLNSIIL